MPEIAEVRTVARTLNNRIVGRTIIGLDIIYDGIIKDDITYFKDSIINRTITLVDNYGKWLFIVLGDITIMSHLRMEGKYFIKDKSDPLEKHEHIIFHLDNNLDLRYHDTRKFGIMKLVNIQDIYKSKEISKLGIEPDNKCLTKDYLYNKIHVLNKPIKTVLLDQSIINGLGNIYADEVLFAANIIPTRLSNKITKSECQKIVDACNKIIKKATSMGGTTIRSYTSSLGVYGKYQSELMVHTRENENCLVCNTIIKKIRVGGRGTYYCPKCQK
jgi:formamidopyrimidine-DNA glycosylase